MISRFVFPRYVIKCPECSAVVEYPYDPKYAELARRSPGGLYAVMLRCPKGHLFTALIDENGAVRRVGPASVEAGEAGCELVGDADFLPPAVRQRVAEALKTGNYSGVEKLIEDLKRMGVVRCL
jgi:hypothetical protein